MASNNNEKLQELTIEEKLQHLYELQRIDTEVDKIRTLRGELPLEVQGPGRRTGRFGNSSGKPENGNRRSR